MNLKWKTWMAAGLAAVVITAATGHVAFADSTVGTEEHDGTSQASSSGKPAKPCMQAGHGLFMIGETADLLGIGLRDLKEQMELGKTLSQIAKERKGLSEEQLLQKLKPTLAQRLDQAVEEGCLTKEQAAATKADMDTKLKRSSIPRCVICGVNLPTMANVPWWIRAKLPGLLESPLLNFMNSFREGNPWLRLLRQKALAKHSWLTS